MELPTSSLSEAVGADEDVQRALRLAGVEQNFACLPAAWWQSAIE